MKEFSKYVLATIVGVVITLIVFAVIGVVSVVSVISSSEAPKSVKEGSVLVLDLSGAICEQAKSDPLDMLFGSTIGRTGLNDILSAIRKAKTNDKIEGIYVETGLLSIGYSTAQEIRHALEDFKTSGKWIYAYGDSYTQGAYYIASVADSLFLSPYGAVDIHGIASQTMYVKDLYGKLGVKFQIIKVGKYKSATERYSEDSMSEANREQVRAYVTGLWDNVSSAIAESRNMTTDSINALADKFTMFIPAPEIVSYGLVDGLLYSNEMRTKVKALLGLSTDDEINQLSVADMTAVKGDKRKGAQIAIYYAEGSIVDSQADGLPFVSSVDIVGSKMVRDLEDLAADDDVKAVVLRVNSPGGSASASEQIWHAVSCLKEVKPIVVSMGDYAASGGYYISCNASWIVAQPTTLTGSIGIFGVMPEASELLRKKLALHFDEVKTNSHADFGASLMSMAIRPLDSYEHELLQKYIDHGYSLFRQRVADGRDMKVDEVEEIAQGHVWLGQDAIGVRLVDELGDIDDAIRKAAELANLEQYYTEDYPIQESFINSLLSGEEKKSYLDENICPIQATMPYVISIK